MSAEHPIPDEAAQMTAVTVLTGVPAEDIEEWALVATRPNGLYRVVSSLCCTGHTAAFLAATASDLMTDQAAEHHALTN